jgi:hypothetical protein
VGDVAQTIVEVARTSRKARPSGLTAIIRRTAARVGRDRDGGAVNRMAIYIVNFAHMWLHRVSRPLRMAHNTL